MGVYIQATVECDGVGCKAIVAVRLPVYLDKDRDSFGPPEGLPADWERQKTRYLCETCVYNASLRNRG